MRVRGGEGSKVFYGSATAALDCRSWQINENHLGTARTLQWIEVFGHEGEGGLGTLQLRIFRIRTA